MNNINDFNKRKDGSVVNVNKRDYKRAKRRSMIFKNQKNTAAHVEKVKKDMKDMKDVNKGLSKKMDKSSEEGVSQTNTIINALDNLSRKLDRMDDSIRLVENRIQAIE